MVWLRTVCRQPSMVYESCYVKAVSRIFHSGGMQLNILCLYGIVAGRRSILVKHHMKLCMVRNQHVKDGECLAVMSNTIYQKVSAQLPLVAQWNQVFTSDMIQLGTAQRYTAYPLGRLSTLAMSHSFENAKRLVHANGAVPEADSEAQDDAAPSPAEVVQKLKYPPGLPLDS